MKKEIIFKVLNMQCANCALHLQELEDILPGVFQVAASYHQQQMKVQFEDTLVSAAAIVAAAQTRGYQLELKSGPTD